MKNIFICMIAAVSFAGCIKKDNSPGDTMTATVNGVKFTANSIIATVSSGRFTIDATSATNQSIEMVVEGLTAGTVTYTLDSGNAAMSRAFYTANTAYASVLSKTGTATVNLPGNSRVSGTFSFTCSDGTIITNGVYNSSYY